MGGPEQPLFFITIYMYQSIIKVLFFRSVRSSGIPVFASPGTKVKVTKRTNTFFEPPKNYFSFLRFVNNPWKIEERNLCFVNAPTQAFLNLELTKKHFLGKSFSDLAQKPISAEIKRLLGCNPRSVQSLKELRRLVGISQGKHYTDTQEDSHEFFTFLLNSLRREGDKYLFGEGKRATAELGANNDANPTYGNLF